MFKHSPQTTRPVVLVLLMLSLLSGCGEPHSHAEREAKEAFNEFGLTPPEEKLVPTFRTRIEEQKPRIHEIIETKVDVDIDAGVISAKVYVHTPEGQKVIPLAGELREDFTATLLDLRPISDDQHRLVAESMCMDTRSCAQVVINVYYRVGSMVERQQFISETLSKRSTAEEVIEEEQSVSELLDDIFDHGNPDPEDPENELIGWSQLGEFVGPPVNQSAIDLLIDSEKPTTEVAQSTEVQQEEAEKIEPPSVATPVEEEVGDIESAPKSDDSQAQSVGTQAQTVETIAPTPKPDQQKSSLLLTKSDRPLPRPEKSAGTVKTEPVESKEVVEEVPAEPVKSPLILESSTRPLPRPPKAPPRKATLVRQSLGIDLKNGGLSVGLFNNGRISNSTKLKTSGANYKQVYPERNTSWGSGMMISLIEKVTREFGGRIHPGTTVMIGDISKAGGGRFASHSSHQNGIDVDIPYIGNQRFESILSASRKGVRKDFDFAKNWDFFRLVASQEIVKNGKRQSLLGRIFVHHSIKPAFCRWAKANNILNNDFDREIMRRMRGIEGHDKHFHLRLRCSPHHRACRDQLDPPAGTGC